MPLQLPLPLPLLLLGQAQGQEQGQGQENQEDGPSDTDYKENTPEGTLYFENENRTGELFVLTTGKDKGKGNGKSKGRGKKFKKMTLYILIIGRESFSFNKENRETFFI